jgi:hypothetical protein
MVRRGTCVTFFFGINGRDVVCWSRGRRNFNRAVFYGATFSVRRTVYVQGNKQRVDGERVATITDLDESVVYVIDKEERVYAELPLTAFSPGQSGNLQSETVDLKQDWKNPNYRKSSLQ